MQRVCEVQLDHNEISLRSVKWPLTNKSHLVEGWSSCGLRRDLGIGRMLPPLPHSLFPLLSLDHRNHIFRRLLEVLLLKVTHSIPFFVCALNIQLLLAKTSATVSWIWAYVAGRVAVARWLSSIACRSRSWKTELLRAGSNFRTWLLFATFARSAVVKTERNVLKRTKSLPTG